MNDAANKNSLLSRIADAAGGAGKIILSSHPDYDQVSSKDGRANFVTVYDEQVQDYLYSELSRILPEAHFMGEEEGQDVFAAGFGRGYTFVVDPIDGTSNFMHDYRTSVTSIALLRDGKPYIGVVFNPYTGILFKAQKGQGAYENDKLLRPCSDTMANSLIAMGTAPYYPDDVSKSAFVLGHWYLKKCTDIRRSGSAALDLCMVASGRIGLFFEPVLSLWDYAAGALLVTEAGGRITDLRGRELSFTGRASICAVTKGVSEEDYLPPEELLVWKEQQ